MFDLSTSVNLTPAAAPVLDADVLDADVLGAGWLDAGAIDTWARVLGAAPVAGDEPGLVDALAALERLKSAAAAAQARVSVALAESHAAAHPQHDAAQVEASTGAQVGLARQMSPARGRAALRLARALSADLPFTFEALATGEVSEWQAALVARETAVLSRTDRARADSLLAGRLGPMGDRRIATEARRLADRLDPEAALHRLAGAENERRVSIRPVRDGMVQLSAHLPLVSGIGAYAALRARAVAARNGGDPRGIGQIMADELCARLAIKSGGIDSSSGPDLAVNLVMTEHTLLRGGPDAATVTGPDGAHYGSVPAFLARRLVRTADRVWLRRLYTTPESGELVAMDTRARRFAGRLRDLIVWRDQTCRTAWCEAPIRHVDHIKPYAAGGETTADNAQGLCEACNYLKETTGWHTDLIDTSNRSGGGGKVIEITTPTGHRYRSKAPHQPGREPVSAEDHLAHLIDDQHVA